MNAYGGIDMKLAKGNGVKGNKAAPRNGAAKGQGAGMGGYNAAAVNRAVGAIQGAAKPVYYIGGQPRGK
jgi:hypothetical protein